MDTKSLKINLKEVKMLRNINDLLALNLPSISEILFPSGFELLPSVTEIFELEFAYYESKILSKRELIKRGAYFKSIDGRETIHSKICRGTSKALFENRSKSTISYFMNGVYSTGYATHRLFPYRGKFHPQMIKALMNILGIKEGDIVLDPMCGSGTLNVEAALIGINSIGVDKNPFACFMAKVKLESLSLRLDLLDELLRDPKEILNEFLTTKQVKNELLFAEDEENKIKRLSLLAFLDAMGYARRTTKSIEQLFPQVLSRYIKQVKSLISIFKELDLKLGKGKIEFGDARDLSIIKDGSVDGVITSPPYSFAIDYAENDRPQLEYLGFDVDKLKNEMIGLSGRGRKEKLQKYFKDMNRVMSEISRVLKVGKYAVIIIGSNDIQTGGIRLENKIKEFGNSHGLNLVREIRKPIKGIRNTMHEEFVLIFRKEG
ncbi:TRM11 family SAM-dependent methyltransferase [Thermodesulfatator autotrophicus]|uniref:site-specific DNA-methyltransferase (cytosine-N(4)-specific) n=1 Tax=Thermodesulfatator autotrophicus TaxID=1795632 RepID=A0A177E3Y2_9BACT|nr:DNA methyltransferase [Thermodesulfatator autotrophicus]OAG26683.1 hypothetical protein TH606_11015 [Thermodesulfatator autotrophicus]